ncbi:S8 family serine peptidase [Ideonella sp. 4Y11]|uniref:S8 family serine peptidase n=1 Tax=Ideonella aquatica TaxID=2824119 RepID=A0A940YKJ8_9BURK|nr:S8 family peptidase [Ideonella aquatica]MBQ0961880.1 S8 family serine peptidase [Ideonella aquatica]
MIHPFSRRALLTAVAIVCSSAGLSAWAGQSAEALALGAPSGAPSTDRLIVKYRDGALATAAMDRAQELANRSGVQLRVLRDTALGAKVIKMDQRLALKDARRLARALAAADPDIEYAEPDQILQAQLTPNDTSYASQWHYYEATGGLNLPTAWDKSTGTGVVVAVVDTGYRPHADLAANLVAGYDMIADTAVANDGGGRDADPSDPGDWIAANECGYTHSAQNSSWHGTHVAGTIAAVTNNASGVAGVAFGAKVQPVRVLGKCGGYTSDIADGIIWASGGTVSGVPANATPARVINMSLGGSGACSTTTQNAINGARSRGTVVVVAAGNSNANASNFNPANCAGVITVAAVGRTGARAYYSNYGAVVDLAAPGGDMSTGTTNGVYSTLNAGTSTPGADSYAYYEGTSMATPHVAGAAALMLAANPALTPDDVEARMKASTRAFPGTCSQCGTGIVDANAAVDAAVVVTPPPTWTDVTEVESNNTRSRAQTISPDPARVLGTIGSTSDTDYFKFSVASGATVVGTLTPNASSDYDLYLYNSSGTQLASSTSGTGLVDTITRTNTGAATTWYLRVVRYSGGTGATNGQYTLTIDR